MLKTGDLVRLYGYLERKEIGIILRHNPRFFSYTIYWVKTGKINAVSTSDVRSL